MTDIWLFTALPWLLVAAFTGWEPAHLTALALVASGAVSALVEIAVLGLAVRNDLNRRG